MLGDNFFSNALDAVLIEPEKSQDDKKINDMISISKSEKSQKRLGSNGEEIEAGPFPEVAHKAIANPETLITTGEPLKMADDTMDNIEETTQVKESSDKAIQAPIISQKAFLYEEHDLSDKTSIDSGTVIWSLLHQSPGNNLPPEPAIQAKLEIPGRGFEMVMTIKRNVDKALAASHMVEIRFSIEEDFSGGEIDNIKRFVMKSDEQARGEALIAVPVKINNSLFLIALNNLPQAVQSNLSLLRGSDWIDIPVLYTTGRRALLTLEKGGRGAKIFSEALIDWQSRGHL